MRRMLSIGLFLLILQLTPISSACVTTDSNADAPAIQAGVDSASIADSSPVTHIADDPRVKRLTHRGRERLLEGFVSPVWSPDGESIAVIQSDGMGIWRMDPDGTRLEQLTAGRVLGHKLSWSPDNRYIAYRAERRLDHKRYLAIQVVDVEDKTTNPITDFVRFVGSPSWVSSEGTIAFETDRGGTMRQAHAANLVPARIERGVSDLVTGTSVDQQIWVSRADGSDRIQVSGEDERCFGPVLSPDGRRVCYTSSKHGGSISVVSTDGSNRTNLGRGSNPDWSPDGLGIVYEVTEDDGHYLTGSDLYIIGVDGEGRTQLTNTPDILERWPSWSPDGSQIAFSADGAIYTLLVPQSATSRE